MTELIAGLTRLNVFLLELEGSLPLRRQEHWPTGAVRPTVTTTQGQVAPAYTLTFLAEDLDAAEAILNLYAYNDRVTLVDDGLRLSHTTATDIRVTPVRVAGVIKRWQVRVEGINV